MVSKSKRTKRTRSRSRSKGCSKSSGICMAKMMNYGLIGAIIIGVLVMLVQFMTGDSEPKALEGHTSKTLYLFHMDGCRHCKDMMPEWDKFEASNPTNVKTKKLEAEKNKPEIDALKQKFGLSFEGYPTMMLCDEEKGTYTEYKGGRNAQEIESFCNGKAHK